ncbi:MAG TPA: membrane dipeptidase [Prolixibacteraceae bacterium]|nr:membrane dipeptidase [Prolixibacteraceae bacterium]
MNYFADIHSHPTMKSYGHSFPSQQNSKSPLSNSSIWYYDPPNFFDKLIDLLGGIVKYRQSNFSAMGFGNTGIVFATLYPIERGFFDNKLGTGDFNDMLLNFITSVGKNRIDFIQSITDYFPDLENEYNYLTQLDGTTVKLADKAQYQYVIAKNATDIDIILNKDTIADKRANSIAVIVSIEGGHVFGTGIHPETNPANPVYVLNNVDKVKNWSHRPVFMSLAHHFYNELCGHAQSLTGIVRKATNQQYGMNEGFTQLGRDVLDKLLDNSDNKRILIDIKHMSRKSRLEYFNLLETKYKTEDIPVIISHGAVMGNEMDKHLFLQEDINFYDDEIVKVAATNGLFGLQLDERRIVAAGDFVLKKSHGFDRRKVLYYSSVLAWRQIQHIAELLDSKGLFAWGIQSLGSDYDGMINPINGFWTAEDYPTLADYLLKQAFNYTVQLPGNLTQARNRIDPEEIVDRIMGNNAYNFLHRYYR